MISRSAWSISTKLLVVIASVINWLPILCPLSIYLTICFIFAIFLFSQNIIFIFIFGFIFSDLSFQPKILTFWQSKNKQKFKTILI